MRRGRIILAGRVGVIAGVVVALVAALSSFVVFNALFDGWNLSLSHGTLRAARYRSPQNVTSRREAGITPVPADARSFRLWFPPNPPPAPPLPASGPTSLVKRVVAQGTYTIPAQRWTAGLFAWESINGFGIRSEALLVALWTPALLLIAGGAGLWKFGARRARPGVCGACGYALAGLAAGAPCPECGPKA